MDLKSSYMQVFTISQLKILANFDKTRKIVSLDKIHTVNSICFDIMVQAF